MEDYLKARFFTLVGVMTMVLTFYLGRSDGANAVQAHCESYQQFEYKDVLYSCNKVNKGVIQ